LATVRKIANKHFRHAMVSRVGLEGKAGPRSAAPRQIGAYRKPPNSLRPPLYCQTRAATSPTGDHPAVGHWGPRDANAENRHFQERFVRSRQHFCLSSGRKRSKPFRGPGFGVPVRAAASRRSTYESCQPLRTREIVMRIVRATGAYLSGSARFADLAATRSTEYLPLGQ